MNYQHMRIGDSMERKHRIYIVKYYNVLFYLIANNEQDIYKIELFGERIAEGKQVKMKDIHMWCLRQDINYKTEFKYCREYPVQANIWNFYSYCRFETEKKMTNLYKKLGNL